MTEKHFFDKWIGTTVTFDEKSSGSSTWRLERKLSDKNDQVSAYAFHEDRIYRGRPGAAYGSITCRNVDDGTVAVLKIVMQYVPAPQVLN